MRIKIVFILLVLFQPLFGQDIVKENLVWRDHQNKEFRDDETSPLTPQDRKGFDSLSFYPIKKEYYLKAMLKKTPESKPFKMPTSTERMPLYRQYGIAEFELHDTVFTLPVYQSLDLMKKEGYENYLFIPFTDLTNGFETYGGGRYLEGEIPEGHNDTIILDFNKAYNPYCAYSSRYSCPIPPKESHLNTKIEAGTKAFGKHH